MKVKVLLAIKAKPFFRNAAAWWLGCWILVIVVAWLLAPQLKRGRTPTYLDVYGVILLYSVLTIIGPEKSSFKLSLQYGISRRNYTLMMILFQLMNALFLAVLLLGGCQIFNSINSLVQLQFLQGIALQASWWENLSLIVLESLAYSSLTVLLLTLTDNFIWGKYVLTAIFGVWLLCVNEIVGWVTSKTDIFMQIGRFLEHTDHETRICVILAMLLAITLIFMGLTFVSNHFRVIKKQNNL